jgi:hypothetical protein
MGNSREDCLKVMPPSPAFSRLAPLALCERLNTPHWAAQ